MSKYTPKNKHDITPENYFSKEIGIKYLSSHSLMTFLKDPSLFWLKAHGHVQNTSSESADAGRLFHAFMETEEAFKEEIGILGKTPFTKLPKGSDDSTPFYMLFNDNTPEKLNPKATFKAVWDYILDNWESRYDIWQDDEYEKEIILTGQIGNAQYKGRLDCFKIEGRKAYIYDYKTLALKERYGNWQDGEGNWHPKTFIQERDYDLQMIIYSELVKQNFDVDEVYITFGVLVKGGKHEFTEYPTSFINTETVNYKDLIIPRFNGRTAYEVLFDEGERAYDALKMDLETFSDRYGSNNLFLKMLYNDGKPLSPSEFILK